MKLSELISKLQAAQNDHGDIEVVVVEADPNDEDQYTLDPAVEVHHHEDEEGECKLFIGAADLIESIDGGEMDEDEDESDDESDDETTL